MPAQFIAQFRLRFDAGLERDERDERLAFQFIGPTDHRGFGHIRVADQRALDFGRPDAMTGHVEHVVDAAHDPEVTVLVLPATVAGEVGPFDFAPINFLITLRVAPDAAQHVRPRFADDELAAGIAGNRIALVVHHLRYHPEERQCGGAWLGRDRARQRRDHDAAGFSLPPGIHDGTSFAADDFVIPNPGFRIDRFPDRPEQSQGTQVVFLRPLRSPFHERADRGRRGVKNRHAVFGDDTPETVRLRPVRRAFIHQTRRAIGQRPVNHVTVAGHPAHVGGAPVNVGFLNIENILVRELRAEQIAGCGVENPFGFPGRTACIENKQRCFAVHFLRRAIRLHIVQLAMPPHIAPFRDMDLVVGAPEDNHSLDRLRQEIALRVLQRQRFVHVFLQLHDRAAPEPAVRSDHQFRL